MCLSFEALFSPLEQFEISSFNTFLNYFSTLQIENCFQLTSIWFDKNFNYSLNLLEDWKVLILYFFFLEYIIKYCFYTLSVKELFKFFWEVIFLGIFISILTTNFNLIKFTDMGVFSMFVSYHFDDEVIGVVWEPVLTFLYVIGTFNYNYIGDPLTFETILTSYINFYSVIICFVLIYVIIYLIFNKFISNNKNTLIPTFYQMIGENLFKVSLNLFYSILGKNISIPEFFIKINTVFIFLMLSNVQGMIPYMNTLTSSLTNTFFIALALFFSILSTFFSKKGFWFFFGLFLPSGCPLLLSLLIIPIELISYSFRLVSLSVRLFANMMAGHTLLKVIVGFSWIIIFLGKASLINLIPIIILMILILLEFGVAFIQSYIFTVLSCIYLRDIFESH